MDIVSRIKHSTILLQSTKKRSRNPKKIFNQPTLIATMLSLKENEKVVIAAARVKDSLVGEQVIPFCFKSHRDLIPVDIKPCKLSPKNTVLIMFENLKPIDAMILAVGEDSQEIDNLYKQFLQKTKSLKAQKKTVIWLTSEKIKFKRTNSPGLSCISRIDFEQFIKKAGREKPKKNQTSTPIRDESDIVTIDSENDDEAADQASKPGPSDSRIQLIKVEREYKPNLHHLRSISAELNEASKYQASLTNIRNFQVTVSRAFDILVSYLEVINCSESLVPPNMRVIEKPDNYFIPAFDRTYESGRLTYIEGLLPVSTKKYKNAMKSLPSKLKELEPTLILTTIVKFTFPPHWIIDVTLRGTSDKKALVNIWNHHNPIANPCEGTFENGLGVTRLRALLDHSVRKSGRLSYDVVAEKALHNHIAKSMHYVRTQLAVKVSRKDSKYYGASFSDDFDEENDFLSTATDNDSAFLSDQPDPDDSIRVTRKRARLHGLSPFNPLDTFPDENDSDESSAKALQETYPSETVSRNDSARSHEAAENDKAESSQISYTQNDEKATGNDKSSGKRSVSSWETYRNKKIKSTMDAIRSISIPQAIQESDDNSSSVYESFNPYVELASIDPTNVVSSGEPFDSTKKVMNPIILDSPASQINDHESTNVNSTISMIGRDSDVTELSLHQENDSTLDPETDDGQSIDAEIRSGTLPMTQALNTLNANDETSNSCSIGQSIQDPGEIEMEEGQREINDDQKDVNESQLDKSFQSIEKNPIDSEEMDQDQDENSANQDQSMSENIALADSDGKETQVDLEALFAQNPNAALIYLKENNLLESYMAKISTNK